MGTLKLTAAQREKERKSLFKLLLISLLGSAMLHAIAMAVPTPGVWRQAEAEDDEMEVVIENTEDPPKVEEPQEVVKEPEAEIAPQTQDVAFTSDIAPPPPPLAPESQAPLAPGEDAPSNQPPSRSSDAVNPMTSKTGEDSGLRFGSGPIFSPFGTGFGFGNASRPTGFNPLGQPNGDPKGTSGGTPGGIPGGTPGGIGGTPGSTATRTTAPPVAAPKPNQPACVSCPKPKYRGSEGSPRVDLTVRPDGSVEVRLRQSSGNPETDRETLETMSKWRFDPKTIPEGGVKKRVRVEYEEEGSNRQRQNEERRRQETERRQIAEQERQQRESQERQRQPPTTAVETPAKPAPSLPVAAPAEAPPAEKPAIENPVAPPLEAAPVPVEPPPVPVEAAPPPEPAPAAPEPAETAPPPASGQ